MGLQCEVGRRERDERRGGLKWNLVMVLNGKYM